MPNPDPIFAAIDVCNRAQAAVDKLQADDDATLTAVCDAAWAAMETYARRCRRPSPVPRRSSPSCARGSWNPRARMTT
jgi:hypothetical protein